VLAVVVGRSPGLQAEAGENKKKEEDKKDPATEKGQWAEETEGEKDA